MADISMCLNKNCPLRMKCYRYTAIPDKYWQSYANFAPDQSGKCDDFWDNSRRTINPIVKEIADAETKRV